MATNRDPSPGEIRQICAEIQSTWTAAERMKRLRADLRPHYTRCDGETEEMTADVYNGHHEQRQELQEIER
jgi:hypothetical protein